MAVVVSRGEPRRDNLQMEQAVAEQIRGYRSAGFVTDVDDMDLARAVQLIAEDYITPVGSQAVVLNREHLLHYLWMGRQKVDELREAHVETA